jgi:carboxyl-terminal processing protease
MWQRYFIKLIVTIFTLCLSAFVVADSSSSSQDADITQFVNTIDIIKKDYALPISDKKLLESAIRGMVNNLDPHSEYLDEEDYKALLMSTSGAFGGLGIEVMGEFGVLKVITPIRDTPASRAGIKSGDYIVALNGKLVTDMTLDQALAEMRGEKGTQIDLTVIRKGENAPIKFALKRDMIHVENIQSKLIDNAYGYVRINQFQSDTSDDVSTAINNLQKEAGGHLKGLVLDLRNNPGGLLESAVNVVDVFLDSDKLDKYNKLIVYTEGRDPDAQYKAFASGHDLLDAAPLVVLINEGSASASEIVAGALQDYHRALIVGKTSFGKGSVQTVIPLDKTHAIKLTTALYLTPAGRIIQNQGIIPDIAIANIKASNADNNNTPLLDEFKESSLKNHLVADNQTASTADSQAKELMNLAAQDFQLYESINILKTMSQEQAIKP